VATAVLTQSCKEDESSASNNGTLNFQGESIKIKTMVRDDDTEAVSGIEGLYFHPLIPLTGTMKISNNQVKGKGDLLFMGFNTASATELTPGTYTVSTDLEPFTVYVSFIRDTDFDKQTSGDDYAAESGTITVSKEGDQYTFEISVTIDGTAFSGTYTGPLAVANLI
jgi:hypothetical protein